MSEQIHLGPLTFHSYDEAFAFAHDTLKKYKKGDVVTDLERDFLIAVLKLRGPEGLEKIGGGIKRIYVDENKFGTICFHLERLDGSTSDFSYIKCFKSRIETKGKSVPERKQAASRVVSEDEVVPQPETASLNSAELTIAQAEVVPEARQVKSEVPAVKGPAAAGKAKTSFFDKLLGMKIKVRFVGGGQSVVGILERYDDEGLIIRSTQGQMLVMKSNITVIEKGESKAEDWW